MCHVPEQGMPEARSEFKAKAENLGISSPSRAWHPQWFSKIPLKAANLPVANKSGLLATPRSLWIIVYGGVFV